MLFVLDALVLGVAATFTMDIVARIAGSFGLVRLQPIGRWFLYMLRGKIQHRDIFKATPLRSEKLVSPLLHYGIGIGLASFYLIFLGWLSLGQGSLVTALAYGLATNILPLAIMFPSMGYGFGGLSFSPKIFLVRQSLITHTAFGAGLWLGMSLLVLT